MSNTGFHKKEIIMWDRKTLKEKGKADFRANRIMCILAAFLLMLVGAIGGSGSSAASAGASSAAGGVVNGTGAVNPYEFNRFDAVDAQFKTVATEDNQDVELNLDDIEGWEDAEDWGDIDEWDDYGDLYDPYETYGSGLNPAATLGLVVAVLAILCVVLVIVILLDVFIYNPITVGLRKFFVTNAGDSSASLSRDTFGYAFYNGYKNIVGAMFVTDLFVFLLTLVLIVPGIIFGKYVWRMVPYILGENPDMKGSDARMLSSQIMDGHKWKTFVLDLSFIGWYLLGIVTLGISNLIWTSPYHAQTDAELYLTLTGRSNAAAPTQGYYEAPQQPEYSEPKKDSIVFDANDDYRDSDSEIEFVNTEVVTSEAEAGIGTAEAAPEPAAPAVEPAAEPAAEAAAEISAEAAPAEAPILQPEDAYVPAGDAENVEDNYNY